ncbi:D-alanyl-D-alanine carboxypeptidase [bacterium]|nr:D-alanyl-D-alanine carboxypeptidase [bacterium]
MLAAALIATLTALATAAAQSPPSTGGGDASVNASDPLNTSATYAYIMDAGTGVSLYSKRGSEPLIPASMTKLMTMYIVFERIRDGRLSLDDELVVSENAWRKGGATSGGSTMFLKLGSRVKVDDLLRGAIVQSGNDACIVLAEGISGTEEAFATLMTERARELGLSSASFRNSTGLDEPDHRISAQDLGRLAQMIIRDFPQFYPIYSEQEFTWNGIRQPNRNPLLREVPGADGLKTGHLEVSGYGLVGSAVQDGKRRIIVLQGLPSETQRAQEARRVMRAAFADFDTVELVTEGAVVGAAEVWLGAKPTVPLVASGSVSKGLHIDATRKISAIINYKGPIAAPVKQGDTVAELLISAPGAEDIRVPLQAGETVGKLNLFGRALVGVRGE